jgi:YggT family protein
VTFQLALTVLRYAVLAATLVALAIALTAQAIRSGRLTPFHPWSRSVRRTTDPVLRWMERRVVRAGGDPRSAPWWLLVLAVGGGLLLLSLVGWVAGFLDALRYAFAAGPVGVAAFALALAYDLVVLALFIRVIGSWFGMGRWHPWLRPAYRLTDWIVTPLGRIIPAIGAVDITPLAAWFVLWVARQLLFTILARL